MWDTILVIISMVFLCWTTLDMHKRYDKIVKDLIKINDSQHQVLMQVVQDILINNQVDNDKTHGDNKKNETR